MTATLIIHLDRLADNWHFYKRLASPECIVGAVVKADAYGLGAARVVDRLWREGCRLFFVAHAAEGVVVRRALVGKDADIIVFHGCADGDEELLQSHQLVPVLNSIEGVERWAVFAARSGYRPAVLHVDTGMNRLGLAPAAFAALMNGSSLLSAFDVRMFMTHLASADEPDAAFNGRQRCLFDELMKLRPAGLEQVPCSVANSAGMLLEPAYHYDVGRVGIGLYGGQSLPEASSGMQPVVQLETTILQVRDVAAGETVSYGGIWQAERASQIATLEIGYADGLFRLQGEGARVAIVGRFAPIVGRVTMDLTMIDVTDLDVVVGDRVELLGAHISIDEMAGWCQTIGYEVLTNLGRQGEGGRLVKRYVEAD